MSATSMRPRTRRVSSKPIVRAAQRLPTPLPTAFAQRLRLAKRPLAKAHGAWQKAHFSTFEKAILANSVIILLDTAAGWWITQHNPEAYHYVIDTSFIAIAAVVGVVINFALLRAAFAPLRAVLTTIRLVEDGDLGARVAEGSSDADAQTLAHAFNTMLDRLALARDETVARELHAQETERRRLALELHDQMGQSLTALTLHAQAITQRLAGEPGEAAIQARAQTERLITLAERTLAEAQALSRQLRPAILDDLGLAAALRWLADDAQQRLSVSVSTRIRDERVTSALDTCVLPANADANAHISEPDDEVERAVAQRLPDDVETTLFRIAQEALTNAVRHGQAQHLRIHLCLTSSAVTLAIGDDGSGFDPAPSRLPASPPVVATSDDVLARVRADHATLPTLQTGIGLAGMRERARLIGGALAIRSQHGCGCVLLVRVPTQRKRAMSA